MKGKGTKGKGMREGIEEMGELKENEEFEKGREMKTRHEGAFKKLGFQRGLA
jgi:hypothetical protein